jgi:acyl-CoA synthetase (AMP-forming)/AMP-acid ligase II
MYAKKNSENGVPALYKMICGTSFLDANSKKEVEQLYNIEILQQYGMTETLFMTINDQYSSEKPDSVGQVIEDVIIEICNGNEIQKPGVPGSIRVKSESCFGSYYFGNQENEAFKNGYFYTGDIGYFDDNKSLFIAGREKDLIKKSGFSISANTISSKISFIEGIDDAYTIGIKDSIVGEEIYSFYISENDFSENDIRLQLKKDIPDKLMPKKIFKIKAFPKTATGKIIKQEMEEILNSLIK